MPTSHPLAGEPDPETLITCPYDSSHRITMKRFQFHLSKCCKNHPNVKKEVCPYNSTHMVNEQEFKFHLQVCSSKGIVDNFRYIIPNEDHVIELPPDPVVPPSEENWDDDRCGTYKPADKLMGAPIIHTLVGGTRSERKKCKMQQRQKFRALEETSPFTKVPPKVVQRQSLPDDQPLRQPTTLPRSLANNSAEFASLNQSFASGISDNVKSTSKLQRKSPVFDRERIDTDLDKMPNLVLADTWVPKKPETSQIDDDNFIVYRYKGRGKQRY